MPERPLLVAAYAAGAGLAAATLVYVFGPTYLLDGNAGGAKGSKKRNVIGLKNPANDCFINSILQALAGSPQLRLYLIREVYIRKLADEETIAQEKTPNEPQNVPEDPKKQRLRASLRTGVITIALKQILDALNERPLHKKVISAQPFISAVERAFSTRVSRYQQDAQEFLQIVLERLADEHKEITPSAEGKIEKRCVANLGSDVATIEELLEDADISDGLQRPTRSDPGQLNEKILASSDQEILPFEGKLESEIECSVCHFKPKSAKSDFVTLTLNVPHGSGATTLDACLDGVFKVEHIEGFRCDRCRLTHALQLTRKELRKSSLSEGSKQSLEHRCTRIEKVIAEDPEHPPKDLDLPPVASAPVSRISKYTKISLCPRLLAIHLSRSVWDSHSSSTKNMAKVSFPEVLTLGPLYDRRTYHLFALVTHKGGHNSGHYETFRRQWSQVPHLTSISLDADSGYPREISPESQPDHGIANGSVAGVAAEMEQSSNALSAPEPSARRSEDRGRASIETTVSETAAKTSSEKRSPLLGAVKGKKRAQNKWWRISDDKVKECKATDVLGMQREVYLLFYELQT